MKLTFRSFAVEDWIFVFVLLAGAVLRLFDYASWSLSNDELSALTRLDFPVFSEMIEKGVRSNDMHPMGVQSFLWFWTGLFGITVEAVRFPFVIAGIASVFLLYQAGSLVFGKAPALMAATMLSLLHFPVLYSQLARPYSPGLFFSLLTFYGWARIFFRDKEWSWMSAMIFIVGGVGCMYSHYFSFLLAGVIGLAGIFLLKKYQVVNYMISGILMFIAYIPNFSVFISQVSIGGLGGPEGWLGKPSSDAIWKYLVYGMNNSLSLILFIFVFSACCIFFFRPRPVWTRSHSLMLLLFLVPVLVAYFYSVYFNPVFQFSVLLFNYPFLLLLLSSWFIPMRWKLKSWLPYGLLVFVLVFSYSKAYSFFREKQFAPIGLVAQKIKQYNQKYSAIRNPALTINVIHPNYIRYYTGKGIDSLRFYQYICNRPEMYNDLQQIVDSTKASVFIHGWANNYHAPETELIIQSKFPYILERDTFFNAGVLVYSRDSVANIVMEDFRFTEANDFEDLRWENQQYCRTDSIAFKGSWCMRIEPEHLYSPGIKKNAAQTGFRKNAVFYIACKMMHEKPFKEAKCVVAVERGDEKILWRGISLGQYPSSPGQWTSFYMGYKLQEDILPTDKVNVYFYNPSAERFFIDDFVMKVSYPRPDVMQD